MSTSRDDLARLRRRKRGHQKREMISSGSEKIGKAISVATVSASDLRNPAQHAAADRIASELRRAIEGEVRFDDGTRALYAYDASVYRQVPIGVVLPKTKDDVVAAVEIARAHQAPLLGRGCGTSLAGQCCNFAIVVDFSKYMHALVELEPDGRYARVQPGIICDTLRGAAEKHHLTFGPDPATHDHCTLGGMIGNNSCGTHSLMAGKTVDNVEDLEILTYDGLRLTVGATSPAELERIVRGGGRRGEIYAGLKRIRDRYQEFVRERFPRIPRRISGYNLDQLLPENGFNVARALVGTESTCALTLEAKVRLVPSPRNRVLVALGYGDMGTAGDDVMELLSFGPIACEFVTEHVVRNLQAKRFAFAENRQLLPEGETWVLVEFGADDKAEAKDKACSLVAAMKRKSSGPTAKLYDDPQEEQAVWEIRRHGVGSTRLPAGLGGHPGWPNWEDAAVPPERLGDYLRDQTKLLARYGYDGIFYGHFGQGCIHCRIDFDLRTAEGIRNFRSFMEDAADLVVSYGGSLSGEHGDGHGRAELWPKMFGPELMEAFGEFKRVWDPHNRMNPGKLVDPYRMDQHLREGTSYEPIELDTVFAYPMDGHSFKEAVGRCFGVGKCRHIDGGTMCPSFMATREEKHSTRGRARLLEEMMESSGPLKDRWRSGAVKEALDLCLACKGCKGDCPVRVDMATYKAEFLSHYYSGRLRPRSAYAMGWIMLWARLASKAPSIVNWATHAPVLSSLLKAGAGIARRREIPRFAERTFVDWFRARSHSPQSGPRVILWPDTFNNYFLPQTAIAATEVLEHAGFAVVLPGAHLCCGRPLYDYGMLGLAKSFLERIIDVMRDQIRDGVPVVGLEPSCVAVFRDELVNLFPHDLDAQRLSKQTFTLGEFLQKAEYKPPKLHRKAIVQRHCHHQAVMGFEADKALLEALELDLQIPDSGCCGMAGSFGYEAGEHYDVSMKCGERVILPEVRKAAEDTIVIADGFSCREQISQTTGRATHHLADVLRLALVAHQSDGRVPALRNGKHNGVAGRVAVAALGALIVGGTAVALRNT
jgi:FAD/FMN-containing dehydrogenase/Fe-S oxidoreductase